MRCLLALSVLFGLLSCISFPAAERARYERQVMGNAPAKKNTPPVFGLPRSEKTAPARSSAGAGQEAESAPAIKTKKNHKDPYFRPN